MLTANDKLHGDAALGLPPGHVQTDDKEDLRPVWKRALWPYAFTALLCLLILTVIYKLYQADLRIPLQNSGDALFYQALFKNFVETWHYYVNPSLGAPGQLELYDFPVPHSTHLLGFAFLRLFTHDYGLAFNLYYLASYPLVALVALYVFRRFRISAGLAVVLAVLYAFLPYHLERAEGHYVHSSYYLVPLAAMLALWLSTGVPLFTLRHSRIPMPTRDGILGIVTCVLLGGDNPYYAFFTGFLLVCGGLLGRFRYRTPKALLSTSILILILLGAFVANLTPNLIYFHQNGRTPIVQRAPGEAEIYGLKIIQLILPTTSHRLPPLAKWKAEYSRQAPLVNENDAATLGLIGSAGFFVLLGVFFAAEVSPFLYSLAVLNFGAVLLGTIGGLGALFSFVVWSQFRGYNRISIFIGFFCLLAVATAIESGITRWSVRKGSLAAGIGLAFLLVVGLEDQIPRHVSPVYSAAKSQAQTWKSYFGKLQASLPSGSMIFQLPYIPFPQSPAPNRLGLYDELIPYLQTTTLHWSHGSIRGREVDEWNGLVAAEPVPELVERLAAAGFSGILVDRFGYSDQGKALESELKQAGAQDRMVSADERYSFFSLSSVSADLKSRYSAAGLDELAHPPLAEMQKGCWPLESDGKQTWNWCGRQGELVIANPSHETRTLGIEILLRTGWTQPSDISIEGPGVKTSFKTNIVGDLWKGTLEVPPGRSVYKLQSDAQVLDPPNDPRHLIFMVQNLKLSELDGR